MDHTKAEIVHHFRDVANCRNLCRVISAVEDTVRLDRGTSMTGSQRISMFVAAGFLLVPGISVAAFNQATCSSSVWGTSIATKIDALEYVKQTTSPQTRPTVMTLYNINTNTLSQTVWTNSNVQYLQPHYGYFVTEAGYDKLMVTPWSNGPFTYSGTINTSTTSVLNSFQQWDVRSSYNGRLGYQWMSDSNVANWAPPSIAEVAPMCKSTQSTLAPNATQLYPFYRSEAILLDSDVFYTHVTQPSGAVLLISLDALSVSSGADVDLYVSTTSATPDDSNFQWRGFSSSASEVLQIPAPGGARSLYIGVHTYSGRGHVAITTAASTFLTDQVCIC